MYPSGLFAFEVTFYGCLTPGPGFCFADSRSGVFVTCVCLGYIFSFVGFKEGSWVVVGALIFLLSVALVLRFGLCACLFAVSVSCFMCVLCGVRFII